MRTDYYILQDGTLKRKENTVYFVNKDEKRVLPINKIYSIYAYGRLSLSSGVVSYLAKNGIPIHFFNYYGFYEGSMYPRETLISGDLVIKQASHYLDTEKRMFLAGKFIEGACGNILKNLRYYSRSKDGLQDSLDEHINSIESEFTRLPNADSISSMMNVEGRIRNIYYSALDEIFPEDYRIITRTRRPPSNKMNTLISFGNSLMYTTVLSEIYNTQLNPTISYLHEPFERRFSLALDVSEIFKPIIIDRIILKLVNKNMLDDSCFMGEIGDMLLSEKGKKVFLQEYNAKLSTTIKHKGLKRNVSYKRLIRLELYKLSKHVLDDEAYKPLVMWW
ncbi:type I-B CRISPR-associated endonuclease Cas1 [Methanococcoides orientis]|uniref:type I-B CRISPR-associated endonuclease Cas1b n=1 Tax=Methanococcoides orientis TaxID=2822137 RepID=UPI001E487957|nr:type I-B CRISPR-associated endonuclease Cas1b [Methanococcoides orientis]UGV41621.1 type I-B CRISPR-associated endonuclease Cas1 [Methanococcoides orientis]